MEVYRWYLVVEGSGSFPFDMLRYDSAHPFEQTDSARMEHHRHERRRIVVERRGVNATESSGERRWESFGWKILLATTDTHEARALADEMVAGNASEVTR